MGLNPFKLRDKKPEDKIFVSEWRYIKKLLSRKITASGGIGVTETSSGWHLRGGGGFGGKPEMIIASEDMVADDTEYDVTYLEADATEGDTVVVRRPNGVLVHDDDVGFLGKDSSGQLIFMHAHTMPSTPIATDTIGVLTEGTEAAYTDTWNAGTTANGLTFHKMVRVGYFHAGDETLYGYIRTEVHDELGHLLSVSAETRVAIDVPAVCP